MFLFAGDFTMFAVSPGPLELGIILVVMLLLFGGRLPNVMRNMGRGITEFKRGIKDTKDDLQKTIDKEDSTSDDGGDS
jgi:sec-independent protein translocase protein TatA